jgi:hypothetical protein
MANDGGNSVPRITKAEHIGPDDTGDNIEAKRVASYVWNVGTSEWERATASAGGGGTQYSEDAAHSSGATGTVALVVRHDAGGSLSDTDGDYSVLQTDSAGRLRVAVSGAGSGGTSSTDDSAFTVGTDAGTGAMGIYQSAEDSVDDGDVGVLAMTANRHLKVSAAALPLPSGAATSAKQDTLLAELQLKADLTETQPVSLASVPSHAVTNAGTFAVQNTAATPAGTNNIGDVDVLTINGVAPAFGSGARGATVQRVTIATDDVVPVTGTFWQATQPVSGTVTANLSATDNAVLDDIAANQTDNTQTTQIVDALGDAVTVTGGKLDVNASIDTTGLATATKQDTGNTSLASIDGKITAVNTGAVVVSSSVLPSGAATAAKQPALGTAGTSSADVITVQGRAAMTPLLIDGSATTQPVSNAGLTELAAAINSSKVDVNIVSSDVASGGTAAADDADFTAGTTLGTPAQGVYESTPTTVTDGDLGTVGITAGRRLKTSATIDAALPAGTNNIGDVDVLSSALPTGASTSAKQDTVIGHLDGVETLLGTIDADTGAIKTATEAIQAGQLPDGHNVTVDNASLAVTGTFWQATQPISHAALTELAAAINTDKVDVNIASGNITGFATSAKQDTIIAHLDGVEGLLTTIDADTGNVATNTATIAGAVSGTEMQVDVLTMPTTTVQATNLDIRDLTATDVVTANLSATDNAVLDSIDTSTASKYITGIGHGVTTVTTAGTDVALAASTACKKVTIQAQTDNTGVIAVGASGVDATVATGTGILLFPGDSYEFDIDNLADIFIDSSVNGEGVRYVYFT